MLYIEFLVESSFAFGISEILPHCLLPFTVLDEKSEELRFSKVAFKAFVFDLQQFDYDVSKYVFVFMLLGVL